MAILTVKEVAAEIGTDPKTFRRFVRATVRANGGTVGEDTPGRGRRYGFDSQEIEIIRNRFEEWVNTQDRVVISFEEDSE